MEGEQEDNELTFRQIWDKPHNKWTGRQELLVSLKEGERGENRAGAGQGAQDHTEQQAGQRVTAGAWQNTETAERECRATVCKQRRPTSGRHTIQTTLKETKFTQTVLTSNSTQIDQTKTNLTKPN